MSSIVNLVWPNVPSSLPATILIHNSNHYILQTYSTPFVALDAINVAFSSQHQHNKMLALPKAFFRVSILNHFFHNNTYMHMCTKRKCTYCTHWTFFFSFPFPFATTNKWYKHVHLDRPHWFPSPMKCRSAYRDPPNEMVLLRGKRVVVYQDMPTNARNFGIKKPIHIFCFSPE